MYFKEDVRLNFSDPNFPLLEMYIGNNYISDRFEMTSSGIYLIEYDCGMFYIGKSVNILGRFISHIDKACAKAHYFSQNKYYLTNNTWAPNMLRMSLAIVKNETIALHIIDRDINNEILRIRHMCNDNMLNITHNTYKDKAISNRFLLSNKLHRELSLNKNKI
jgi:predicted GIY-YIG superfamily endonuclease